MGDLSLTIIEEMALLAGDCKKRKKAFMTVITRFAPSPTGFLHIGSARTALFNWLFARHHGGKFYLRIEDTDRARSTQEAVGAILEGLKWLEITWDGEVVYQFQRYRRHQEVADELLKAGRAYLCYATPEELTQMREEARLAGKPIRYDGRWRDRDPSEAPKDIRPVIRLKAPREGETKVIDTIQGEVKVANEQLDDMVLLRSDGTPTYMLSVVVDDHDMGITHVIRGDDHLNNTFRQLKIYEAMGWMPPNFSHIPLIHGADGAKLSKRHGALGVEAYRQEGFLPEALCNYLLRLGWGYKDEEIIPRDKAIEWFSLEGVGKSPSRFDRDKLLYLNGHYIRQADNGRLVSLIQSLLEKRLQRGLERADKELLMKAMAGLKERAKTINELADNSVFYLEKPPFIYTEKAQALLTPAVKDMLLSLKVRLESVSSWGHDMLEAEIRAFAEHEGMPLGKIAQPLRAALTGTTVSPGIFEVIEIMGKERVLERLTFLRVSSQ